MILGAKAHPSRGTAPRVLLVYPEFPDTFWSFRHAVPFQGKRAAFPPLPLQTVAALLPRPWHRRLVDMNVRRLRKSDLEWADLVFVSAMLVQKTSLHRVVALARSLGKRVALGGPYVSTATDIPDADFVFLGEAERTLPRFARDYSEGAAAHVYKDDDRPPLTECQVPEFGLAELGRYSSMSVQYSRGCPFKCEFCDIIEIYGRVPRTKPNDQLLAELDELKRVGWRGPLFVVDDNFIGNKKNVRRLLPELAEWHDRNGKPFSFVTEASVNLAEDVELLEQMRRAGFRRVFLGIETPVEESLREAQKGQNTRRDLLDSVRTIQSYGMEVMAGFIVGFDNDPEDVFERQIRFIRESAIPLAMVGLLTALPDTQLWRRLAKEGRLLQESTGNNTDCSLNFVPKMNPASVVDGYRSILRTIYSPREYYDRALAMLERVGPVGPEPHTGGPLAALAALVRVTLTLGVRDASRAEFWRYLRRAVAGHREQLALAVTLAAMGYHLRKISQRYCEEAPPSPI
jgi:radical SAM superfamily enzyme YgiQ (UPF0313 family)